MKRYEAEHPDQPILYLDAGRAFPLRTVESDVVIPYMQQAFKTLGLDVINAADQDLDGGLNPYNAIVRGGPFKAVSANLVTIDGGRPVLPPYVVVTPRQGSARAAAPRVAVVGLTRPNRERILEGTGPEQVHFVDPLKTADEILPKARSDSDLLVVLANMSAGTARLLAGKHPEIDLIIGCDAEQYEVMNTEFQGVPIIMTGFQGKYAIRIDVSRQSGPRRWMTNAEVTRIDSNIEPDADATRFIQALLAELDARSLLRADTKKDPKYPDYVGSEACASCHAEAVRIWSGTKHAHAWEPLVKSNTVLNPLCIQCHTVGYLKPNGFHLQASEPRLASVGCESCHGAGGNHVRAPAANKLARSNEETCRGCHTIGQSPDFKFADYWSRIQH